MEPCILNFVPALAMNDRAGRCSAQSRLSCARRRRGHDSPTCALYAINNYLRGGPQGHGWP
eukprot:73362-Pleurochrysis_carterae.AAC.1